MKIQIDLKSALCGLVVGVAAMFAIGAGTSSNQVGKYQITGIGNGTGGWAAVMVDTQTGEAWGMDARNNWAGQKEHEFWPAK